MITISRNPEITGSVFADKEESDQMTVEYATQLLNNNNRELLNRILVKVSEGFVEQQRRKGGDKAYPDYLLQYEDIKLINQFLQDCETHIEDKVNSTLIGLLKGWWAGKKLWGDWS